MAVKITNESSSEQATRIVTLVIEGADDFPRPYVATQTIRPILLRVTFVKYHSCWWVFNNAQISGPRVLSSGREGSELAEAFHLIATLPEWARDIVVERLAEFNKELVS